MKDFSFGLIFGVILSALVVWIEILPKFETHFQKKISPLVNTSYTNGYYQGKHDMCYQFSEAIPPQVMAVQPSLFTYALDTLEPWLQGIKNISEKQSTGLHPKLIQFSQDTYN